MPKHGNNLIGSVETTITVIDAVMDLKNPRATDIADYLEMPISTTHNHLSTLEKHEFVSRTDNGIYDVGYRFLEIGGYRRNQAPLFANAKSEIDDLATETGDLANLVVEEHGRVVHLYLSRGEKAVQLDSYPGMRSYLHTTATGKSILAYLPKDRVIEILDQHGLVQRTENTITDRETLFDELETIHEQGYALDRQERLNGLRCIAAPIITHDNELLGAVSVSGPVSRLEGERFEEELPSIVSSVADVISINSKYG